MVEELTSNLGRKTQKDISITTMILNRNKNESQLVQDSKPQLSYLQGCDTIPVARSPAHSALAVPDRSHAVPPSWPSPPGHLTRESARAACPLAPLATDRLGGLGLVRKRGCAGADPSPLSMCREDGRHVLITSPVPVARSGV